MFSRLKNYYNGRLFSRLFKRFNVDFRNPKILPRCFCSAVANPETNSFSTQEMDTNRISELISDSNCSSIVSEIQNMVARKQRCPQLLRAEDIVHLCSLETRNQRKEYIMYLSKKEGYRRKAADKKKQRLERESKVEDSDEHKPYGLGRNTLLISIRSHSRKQFYDKRLANAVLFGEKIVLDVGYDEFMTEKEKQYTAAQLSYVYTANRENCNPFDLYLCNFLDTSSVGKYLRRNVRNFDDSWFSVTGSSYLDVFPRDKLVYLSPHAEETLKEYDHSAIYIIGAFVDTIKKTKVSFNKAKLEGIKSYSLPLDDYIMWGAGSKSLTINQAFEIMLTMKNTGVWKKAFEVIPQRKMLKIEGSSDKLSCTEIDKNKNIEE
ncbi:hypothetical protein JTE90_019491 [Oedothorax gibbosus]|uniref:RNA (guanine-9-)-methyltransferase domain-containing protein 1 n=1 Tax=Oedothorax gibbosus TaxID=931172 RepID=A0AAV6UIQ7_9ARAC|nr:hypothetical protein JTE90_019491 [Oedothorax gibbosus]